MRAADRPENARLLQALPMPTDEATAEEQLVLMGYAKDEAGASLLLTGQANTPRPAMLYTAPELDENPHAENAIQVRGQVSSHSARVCEGRLTDCRVRQRACVRRRRACVRAIGWLAGWLAGWMRGPREGADTRSISLYRSSQRGSSRSCSLPLANPTHPR